MTPGLKGLIGTPLLRRFYVGLCNQDCRVGSVSISSPKSPANVPIIPPAVLAAVPPGLCKTPFNTSSRNIRHIRTHLYTFGHPWIKHKTLYNVHVLHEKRSETCNYLKYIYMLRKHFPINDVKKKFFYTSKKFKIHRQLTFRVFHKKYHIPKIAFFLFSSSFNQRAFLEHVLTNSTEQIKNWLLFIIVILLNILLLL